jgi:hypothetical protein
MIQGRGSHGEIPKEKKRANSTLSVQQEKLVRFALLAIKLPEVLLFISFARPCSCFKAGTPARRDARGLHARYMRDTCEDPCGIHAGYMYLQWFEDTCRIHARLS